jgi:uncharacterized protein YfaS (alpha-2-macroglobulin family)
MNVTSAKSWAHSKRSNWNTTKIDLTQTVAYTSTGYTKTGQLKGSFVLNDLLTSYEFSVDAFTSTGVLGTATSFVSTKDFLSVAYTLPNYIVVGDSLKVPATITNSGPSAITLNLYNIAGDSSITTAFSTSSIKLAASAAVTVTMTITGVSEK